MAPSPIARVLIADDTPAVSRRLTNLVASMGLVVVGPAADGAQAVQLFRSERPSCAILDFQMPKLNGLQVLQAIREEDHDCLVIILSGLMEPTLEAACLASGANHCLSKASDIDRLIEILQAISPPPD